MIPSLSKAGDKIYLIKVDPAKNNNKYYQIELQDDGDLLVTYGRVREGVTGTKVYPKYKLNSLYNSKIKKGYVDNTEIFNTAETVKNISIIFDKEEVQDFWSFLSKNTRETAQAALSIDLDSVTELQVKTSQDLLKEIAVSVKSDDIDTANELLTRQFTIIPRFVSRRGFQDKLFILNNKEHNDAILENEYDLLEQLKSVVQVDKSSDEKKEALPFNISLINDQSLLDKYYAGLVSDYKHTKVKHVFKIESNLDYSLNNKIELLWHASRNENWISILKTRLQVRPPGVPLTGAMFGNGLYFAPLSQKSVGYTSVTGSYWARGSSNFGVLSLCEVELNKTKINETGTTFISIESAVREGYDSLWCYGKQRNSNSRLWNDEVIIPRTNQVNVRYLFWIKSAS